MILGMEPKNQVNRATRSGVMAISEFREAPISKKCSFFEHCSKGL